MIISLTNDQERIIHNILKPFFKKNQFFYYGSRITGNFEKSSDLDILIKGMKNIFNVIDEISNKFDQSNLPFIVNICDHNKIDQKFYKIIKKI